MNYNTADVFIRKMFKLDGNSEIARNSLFFKIPSSKQKPQILQSSHQNKDMDA